MAATTQKHFTIFKAAFAEAMDRLGGFDYSIEFCHEQLDGRKAQILRRVVTKVATVTLSKSWGDWPVTKDGLEETARHEALHLLISDLACLGAARYVTEDEVTSAEEALVNRMLWIVWNEGLV